MLFIPPPKKTVLLKIWKPLFLVDPDGLYCCLHPPSSYDTFSSWLKTGCRSVLGGPAGQSLHFTVGYCHGSLNSTTRRTPPPLQRGLPVLYLPLSGDSLGQRTDFTWKLSPILDAWFISSMTLGIVSCSKFFPASCRVTKTCTRRFDRTLLPHMKPYNRRVPLNPN